MYPVNKTKEKLLRGEYVFGVALSDIRGITLPSIFANLGFDFLFMDMEHSADSFESMCDMIWTARCAGITPIPRVPDPVRFYISRPLDAGAQGVVVPRIETVEQVDAVVGFCRYPPVGDRGAALGGRHIDYKPTADPKRTLEEANEQVLVGIQIETAKGLERVDDLVARPGVDLVFIGPQDLSVALGMPNAYTAPEMDRAIERIVVAAGRRGIPVGIQGRNVELAGRWMEMGVRFVVFANAVMLLTQAARAGIEALREISNGLKKGVSHV